MLYASLLGENNIFAEISPHIDMYIYVYLQQNWNSLYIISVLLYELYI